MVFDFQHRFVPATAPDRPPLLLLHGTGGDEDDLVPLGLRVAPGAALLSPRGQVLEGGLPRFFSRLREGVFDPVEVRQRAHDLADFVEAARTTYALAAPIALGFSNGANIAAAILALRPETLVGAVLLRPMLVLEDAAVGLGGRRVLILSGTRDPLVSAPNVDRLADALRRGGATVEHHRLQAGHQLVPEDLTRAAAWLAA